MTQVPDYIERRIRQPIPPGLCVVPGSTPVVAFGDARTAKVATLGLNPSSLEFQDRSGNDLVGCFRRLATHNSLGVENLVNSPLSTIAQVLKECNSYFERNPYEWFNELELILNACGVSYCNGSACHLDLVQWATKPSWGDLEGTVKRSLLSADVRFLKEQLSNENIKLLLVNGKDSTARFKRYFDTELKELCPVEVNGKPASLFAGVTLRRIRVIAWSTFLQHWSVHDELKFAIRSRVAQLAQEA